MCSLACCTQPRIASLQTHLNLWVFLLCIEFSLPWRRCTIWFLTVFAIHYPLHSNQMCLLTVLSMPVFSQGVVTVSCFCLTVFAQAIFLSRDSFPLIESYPMFKGNFRSNSSVNPYSKIVVIWCASLSFYIISCFSILISKYLSQMQCSIPIAISYLRL